MSWHAGTVDEEGIVWPRALLVALALATVVALGVLAATSTAAFSPHNPAWDGATGLRDEIEADPDVESELVRDPDRYEAFSNESAANGTVAFVVAPDDSYTDAEAARIRTFVENGGTLVVLENVGENGNKLLADVGAAARTDGRLLRDEYENDGGPAMPVATGVENHSLTDGVDQLTLNYATAVDPGSENTTVLATTSDLAYLTADDDQLDQEDELGTHPVATVENVSRGRVVTVGDPSLVINAMRDRPDNDRFVRELYGDADRVLLDVSHTADVPPLAAAVLTIRAVRPLQLLLGVGGIAAIAAASGRRARSVAARARRLLPGNRSRRADPHDGSASSVRSSSSVSVLSDAEREAIVRRRHPEWDDDRIQRVIADGNRIRRDHDD
ncbi:DUF4350 domain-containing protein [Natrinema sp. SYSU A 869]|uniref:DUF4350 domain-containing protein n=1 Tax=Natrinema sp. SYSU A 869 TaxID=2871694 RepID=UPI001CA45A2A|nr:DUF4350 domain-containing protein [Natrinema sp. SYSU A 869]